MSKIIDLCNGYGRVTPYYSDYATLHFKIDKISILHLYSSGFLTRYQACYQLSKLGYDHSAIKWILAINAADIENAIYTLLNR